MKIKRILTYIGIGLLALLLLATGGLFIWSATSTYPAGQTALAALEPSNSVSVSQDGWIVFSPETPSDTGLIFYPGGLVEPGAYTPVLREIAEQGVLVIIIPMPLNLAILNPNAANAVFEDYPQISDWVLAGHSLGGAAAAIYANGNPGKVNALAFWDSYPPDSADLSNSNLPILSIYGTTGGMPNTDNFDETIHLLPADALFIAIEGGSHAQFGDYGPQAGDVIPSISAEDQHTQIVEAMLTFINK